MEDDGDIEIDPAVAAAMGFSGFGSQPGKKRKFNPNDGFVDPAAMRTQKEERRKGANTTPLGERIAHRTVEATDKPSWVTSARSSDATTALAQAERRPEAAQVSTMAGTNTTRTAGTDKPTLEALRNGVRNECGDMVYFLPSFIEDPWRDLKPK